MKYPRSWLEDDAIPGMVQSKGEVHILEIRAKFFRETADLENGVPAVESTRRAGAEDAAGTIFRFLRQLSVAALAGNAAQIITVARAVDSARYGLVSRPLQDERRHRGNSLVGKGSQCRVCPPRGHLRVVVQQFNDWGTGGAKTGVDGGAEASLAGKPDDSNLRKRTGNSTDRLVRGAVVHDDYFRPGWRIANHAGQAVAQQISTIVAGNHDG